MAKIAPWTTLGRRCQAWRTKANSSLLSRTVPPKAPIRCAPVVLSTSPESDSVRTCSVRPLLKASWSSSWPWPSCDIPGPGMDSSRPTLDLSD